jgi:glyoxylate utilization-related uncharacterized protein
LLSPVTAPVIDREGNRGHEVDFRHHGLQVRRVIRRRIAAGTITARIGAEDMAVKSGEMFYVEPGQTMKVSNAGDKPGTILVILLAKKGKSLKTPVK